MGGGFVTQCARLLEIGGRPLFDVFNHVLCRLIPGTEVNVNLSFAYSIDKFLAFLKSVYIDCPVSQMNCKCCDLVPFLRTGL